MGDGRRKEQSESGCRVNSCRLMLTENTNGCAGAGIKLMNADLDYAMSPEGSLGSIQRMTLKKKF